MTKYEIEIKEKLIDYITENGVGELTSFEIDFIESFSDSSEEIRLSEKQFEIMIEISDKLNI